MSEAKTLVHMAITAMFGAVILSCALGLIYTGYNIWSLFSKQEQVNKIMQDHAQYSAFDHTTVRGQEVLSLISSTKGELFILCISDDNKNQTYKRDFVVYNASCVPPCKWSDLDVTATGNNSAAYGKFIEDTITAQDSSVLDFLANFPNGTEGTPDVALRWEFGSQAGDPSLEDIQKNLINQGVYITKRDTNGNTKEESGYAKYNSFLVYESADSSEIVGVVLVRDTSPIDTTIE